MRNEEANGYKRLFFISMKSEHIGLTISIFSLRTRPIEVIVETSKLTECNWSTILTIHDRLFISNLQFG